MKPRTRSRWSLFGALACACASDPKPPPGALPPVAGVVVAPAEPCPEPAPVAVRELPSVELHKPAVMAGSNYTVWGLGYSLRSRPHRAAVTRQPIVVYGYVVATNLATAPVCAVHKGGIADPEDCRAPIPAFWLADRPDADIDDSVKVMGFASNYAQLYDAIHEFDRGKPALDAYWGVEIPNPLPAVGAQVAVTGTFGTTFSMSSSGSETDDIMGIVTFNSMETLEPAAELATLPGVKRKPPP